MYAFNFINMKYYFKILPHYLILKRTFAPNLQK